jgi:ABC-2 type transport system permease protein
MRAPGDDARFGDLLAAEWIKLWSLRSTWWAVGVSALAIIWLNVNAAFADYRNWPGYPASIRGIFVPVWALSDAFTQGAAMTLMLVAGTLGALIIVGEYSSGLARTTFAAVPARRSVVAAKASVLTAVTFGHGAVIAAVSFGVTQAILSGRHVGMSIGDPAALRVVAASALLAPVCALVGMGLGALIRHGAASVVATTLVLLLLPTFFNDRHAWAAAVLHAMPYGAWNRLVDSGVYLVAPPHPASVDGAWLVFAVWPLVAAVIAGVAVGRRDL